MRALHLCFQLHHPYVLNDADNWGKGYFGGEAEFKEADKRDFQPLFALLERNVQRYKSLHVSLMVSGVWLEQVERWDIELISRLKKLVQTGQVELVALPYYYAMAAFYDLEELESQVRQVQEKLNQLLGESAGSLALPGLCYHNRLARWAEKMGFRSIWAGEARGSLAWRSVNSLYAVKGCENLRVIFVNQWLSEMVATASDLVTVQVESEIKIDQPDIEIAPEQTKITAADFVRGAREAQQTVETKEAITQRKTVFAAKKFQKQLELEFMRGNLINLQFEAGIFGKWRELGIVGFFDELLKIWLEIPGGKMVGVSELAKMEPVGEVSIKKTASLWGEAEREYGLPANWTDARHTKAKTLYALRPKVLASKEQDLYRDFATLTALDYAEGGVEYEKILADLDKKLSQYVMTTDDGKTHIARGAVAETTAVKIKFDHTAREMRERNAALYQHLKEVSGVVDDAQSLWTGEDADDMEAAIQVMAQRMKRSSQEQERDVETLAEAELVDDSSDFIEMDDVLADLEIEEDFEEEPVDDVPKKPKKSFKKIVID